MLAWHILTRAIELQHHQQSLVSLSINLPRELNGRTLTTTLMLPPPAGAMITQTYAGTQAGPLKPLVLR